MSYHEYAQSRFIEAEGWNFYALVMAAMRQADTGNYALLSEAFPEVAAELQARYAAPGGLLPTDPPVVARGRT